LPAMKRHGRLFEQVIATSNLWSAWLDFRRGKRRRPSVRAFELDADREAREAVAEWLRQTRRLRLKKPAAAVRSTRRRVLYLGHWVDRGQIRPGPAALRRARQRLACHLVARDADRFERSLASYRGILLGPVNPPRPGGA